MMKTVVVTNTESAIWERLLRPAGQSLTVAAARALLELDFPTSDKERMRELAALARDGSLSDEDREAIRNYEQVGNLLALMKSKARQRLKLAGRTNGSTR